MAEDTKTVTGAANEDTSPGDKEKASWEKLAITMDKRSDLAVSLFIVSVGVLLLIGARDIETGLMPDQITSRGMPDITGLFLVIVGVVLAVRQLLHWSELTGHLVPEEGQEDEKGYPATWVRAFGIILLSVLWAWLLNPLGFLIATPLYLFLSSWVMGERSWGSIIAFSVIFAVSIWVIFGPILGIRFPLGPLSHLALSLGLVN